MFSAMFLLVISLHTMFFKHLGWIFAKKLKISTFKAKSTYPKGYSKNDLKSCVETSKFQSLDLLYLKFNPTLDQIARDDFLDPFLLIQITFVV